MKAQTIAIIGLGREGTSLGLAVKNSLKMNVVGFDEIEGKANQAETLGAVDQLESSLPGAAAKADILVLTTPIADLEDTISLISDVVQQHTVILDLSKMKAVGLKWADQHLKQGHYVGAVPILAAKWLADGRDDNSAATPDLFQDSLFAIMPSVNADPQAVETAVNFGIVIGAKPYFIDAGEYDQLVQGTDTLSGLIALSLMNTLRKSQSWQDMLRMAGLSFSLNTQPLAQPKDIAFMTLNDKMTTMLWLDAFMKELTELRRIIYDSDPAVVTAVIEDVAYERDRWLLKRQDNEWDEDPGPNFDNPSMMGQLFGGFVPGRNKKND